MLALIVVAAALRLWRPSISPPGLNQDEALSGWISWCLLKTGHDMSGQAWPIFYTRGIGDYPCPLFFYAMMPFQALGGLGVWTTRLPAMVSGILCVPLIAHVGTRMYGRLTGVLAAALLALNPWHLFLSRFGTGAVLCPLFALIALACLLEARLPIVDGEERPPRPAWAAVAGLAAGLSCYGFHAMKLYVPALFALLVATNPAAWWNLRRSRRGLIALLLLLVGFGATFGPLALRHLVDPMITRRWEMTRLWQPGTPLPTIVGLILDRYVVHFAPRFLFARGDWYEVVNPLGRGAFEWILAPCMVAGLIFAIARARSSPSARLLLALLLAFPAGDLVSRYDGVHALRSAPGVPALVLLAAWGAVTSWAWLWPRGRALAWGSASALAIGMVANDGANLVRYFGAMNAQANVYHGYQADLVEATNWLKPRLAGYDAVFCTTIATNQPFAVTLVALGYDPRRWFAEPRDVRTLDSWDVCLRYGKMRFMYGKLWQPDYLRLVADGRPERALFIVRPGELGLKHPIHVIRRPDGREVLWLCEGEI